MLNAACDKLARLSIHGHARDVASPAEVAVIVVTVEEPTPRRSNKLLDVVRCFLLCGPIRRGTLSVRNGCGISAVA